MRLLDSCWWRKIREKKKILRYFLRYFLFFSFAAPILTDQIIIFSLANHHHLLLPIFFPWFACVHVEQTLTQQSILEVEYNFGLEPYKLSVHPSIHMAQLFFGDSLAVCVSLSLKVFYSFCQGWCSSAVATARGLVLSSSIIISCPSLFLSTKQTHVAYVVVMDMIIIIIVLILMHSSILLPISTWSCFCWWWWWYNAVMVVVIFF